MKKSLRLRVAFSFISLIALSVIVNSVLNYTFLPRYYLLKKAEILECSWDMINTDKDVTIESSVKLIHFCINNNLNMVGTDANLNINWFYAADEEKLQASLFGHAILGDTLKSDIIKNTGQYQIQRSRDPNQNLNYLELWGKMDNGGYFLVRTPLQSIQDASQISNQFYFNTGLAVLIAGGIAIWFITKRIVKPIQELTAISQQMADLDFDARYESGGEDEIGELGNNFNKMSCKLEETITELKKANVELQKDIEKKTQIDEMRKEFLSNVTHELKTPIALIQGYAEGLKDCVNDDPESREYYCDVIIDESGKMNQMVKKLLNLNQLESGNDQVSMERFDLAELIRGVLQSSHILIEQKEAKVIFQPKGSVNVWGDEFKIEEVFTNYLTNALNHLNGEKTIEITCEEKEGIVKTTVFNTGEPIPEEDLDKVWIKFYKVDKARTREYGGSGIGLSIVKAIMDSMHQECGATNYENGVAFWFTLESK